MPTNIPSAELDLRKRYYDAYRVANAVTGLGTVIKFLGFFTGLAVSFGGVVFAKGFPEPARGLCFFGGLMSGFLILVLHFCLGILLSAVGQMLYATIDSAVNTSPLMSDGQKRVIIAPENA